MIRQTTAALFVVALLGIPRIAAAQHDPAMHDASTPRAATTTNAAATHDHEHGAPVPAVSYADLQKTTEQLTAARAATEKYKDVHAAEAAGYRAIGPDVPGMGLHYVRVGAGNAREFSIDSPPILLYERDDTAQPVGLRLVGVSYLLVAPTGADGQPANPPFPKALASWHKHNNVCVLPNNDATIHLTEEQCTAKSGRFTAETSWMVHAWIWKDSPTGVFAPTNPLVK